MRKINISKVPFGVEKSGVRSELNHEFKMESACHFQGGMSQLVKITYFEQMFVSIVEWVLKFVGIKLYWVVR